MDRAMRGNARRAFAAVVLLTCAGCSSGTPAAAPAPPPDPSSASPSASPTAGPSTPPTAAPSPGDLRTPLTSSGPLSQASFPRPRTLGPGWSYAVDPGDAEEGYLGNGTPALARNPREIVQAALPLGCPRGVRLPVPSHALEVDYRFRTTKVIAIRMSFPATAGAHAFYAGRRSALERCRGRSGGPGIGALVREVEPVGAHAVLSDRTPDSDPWTELAVADGSDVVLVAAQAATGTPPLTRTGARSVAAALRR